MEEYGDREFGESLLEPWVHIVWAKGGIDAAVTYSRALQVAWDYALAKQKLGFEKRKDYRDMNNASGTLPYLIREWVGVLCEMAFARYCGGRAVLTYIDGGIDHVCARGTVDVKRQYLHRGLMINVGRKAELAKKIKPPLLIAGVIFDPDTPHVLPVVGKWATREKVLAQPVNEKIRWKAHVCEWGDCEEFVEQEWHSQNLHDCLLDGCRTLKVDSSYWHNCKLTPYGVLHADPTEAHANPEAGATGRKKKRNQGPAHGKDAGVRRGPTLPLSV